jgi:hypothetical protein
MRYRIKPDSINLHIEQLEFFASATVTTAPDDPATTVAVHSQSADWVGNRGRRYYQIRRPTGELVRAGEGRMNDDPDVMLEVFGFRNGDPGLEGRERLLKVASGDIVTVYRQRVPVPNPSRIEADQFLKKWDVPFNTDQPQTQYPSPQPNFGGDVAAVADPSTGVARLPFNAFLSGRETFAWSGVTPDLTWSASAGGTQVTGTSSDPEVEFEFVPGQHEIRLRADDTGAAAPVSTPFSNGRRNVFVRGDGWAAFDELVSVVGISEDPHTSTGRTMIFTVETNVGVDLSSYFYAGASVLFTYTVQEKVDGAWVDHAISFKGYLVEFPEVYRDNRGVVRYQLRVENPMTYFGRLGITSQLLQVANPPTNWLQVHPSLANLAFVVYYLMEHNAPNLLNLVDFIPGNFVNYFFPEFSFGGSSLKVAAENAAKKRTKGNIGSLSDGGIIMKDHPFIFPSTASPSKRTWTAGEFRGKISYPRSPIPKNARTKGAAFTYNQLTNETFAGQFEANLLAPGYGEAVGEVEDFLVTGLVEAANAVGNVHAFENRPTESATIDVNGMIDLVDPAEMTPHTADVQAYDPLDLAAWGDTFLPVSVQRNWSMKRTAHGREIFDPHFTQQLTITHRTEGVQAPERTDPNLGQLTSPVWCCFFDFTTGKHGWVTNDPIDTYVAGVGWVGIPDSPSTGWNRARISKTFPRSTVISITATYDMVKGSYPLGTQLSVWVQRNWTGEPSGIPTFDDRMMFWESYNDMPEGTNVQSTNAWSITSDITALQITIASARGTSGPPIGPGSVTLKSLLVSGTGNAIAASNCGGGIYGTG